MPVWVKIILFLWVITPALDFFVRIWGKSNVFRCRTSDYPAWVVAVGILNVLDVLFIIPLAFWFLFLR